MPSSSARNHPARSTTFHLRLNGFDLDDEECPVFMAVTDQPSTMPPLLSHLKFATFPITNQIFFHSPLSVGIVNLKPLVPGHVLVIPQRVTARFNDLSPPEITDLFTSVQQISRVIEKEYKAQSLTIACQDGPMAGQSVPHVHIHILPRHAHDFNPKDEVYTALDSTNIAEAYQRRSIRSERIPKSKPVIGVDADEDRKPRSMEEMRIEAMRLTKLFPEENRTD